MIEEFNCLINDEDYIQIEVNDISKKTYITIYKDSKNSDFFDIVLNPKDIDDIIDILQKAKKI